MKNWLTILFLSLSTIFVTTVYAASAQLGGQANGYSCYADDANRWKVENGNTATLPEGYSFAKISVKAGNGCVSVYPVNDVPTCYQVNVSGTTVTVTKIGDGPDCKDISHLEGTFSTDTSASPSPSGSVSPSPSASPSPTPTPTSTPATSATPSPESTPTPGEDNNQEEESPADSGQVLGTFAETGAVEDAIMNALGQLGGLMTAAGTVLYGKKKTAQK